MPPDDSPHDTSRWMTYDQLGAARSISRASAIRLVRRRKWQRQTDNQGRVTVLVPAEAEAPADTLADVSRSLASIEALVGERMADMSRQLEEARAEASSLREAAAVRRARSLWARLLDAWRGS